MTLQVAPSELEGILVSHPSVVDAAVIGIPDPVAGEKPMAFVVVKTGSSVTALDIQDYVTGISLLSLLSHCYHAPSLLSHCYHSQPCMLPE